MKQLDEDEIDKFEKDVRTKGANIIQIAPLNRSKVDGKKVDIILDIEDKESKEKEGLF